MLPALATCLDRRRPAIWKCTVTKPTVRDAGLEPADQHVSATIDPAFTCTTTVFAAETFANRAGGAACYGARLLLSAAVDGAMFGSTTGCVGGAAIKLALATSTMLGTDTTCLRKGGAAFRLAHFLHAVTTMPIAISFCNRSGSRGAVAERAEPKGAVWTAESTSKSSCATPCS